MNQVRKGEVDGEQSGKGARKQSAEGEEDNNPNNCMETEEATGEQITLDETAVVTQTKQMERESSERPELDLNNRPTDQQTIP